MIKLALLGLLIIILGCSMPDFGFKVMPEQEYSVKIHWLGHAGFSIESLRTRLYINPYSAPIGSLKGDGIIITYSGSDFCDIQSINALNKDNSVILAMPECAARLLKTNIVGIGADREFTVNEALIETVHAYHINKSINKGLGVGLIITINNTRIFYAGITDLIPEHDLITDIDVLIMPIAGEELSMNMTEAITLMKKINATHNTPMYYGGNTGTSLDIGREFERMARAEGINVTLLDNKDLLI